MLFVCSSVGWPDGCWALRSRLGRGIWDTFPLGSFLAQQSVTSVYNEKHCLYSYALQVLS